MIFSGKNTVSILLGFDAQDENHILNKPNSSSEFDLTVIIGSDYATIKPVMEFWQNQNWFIYFRLNSQELLDLTGQLVLSKKAEYVQAIDVRKLTSITDYFMICSADTDIQVKAIADAVRKGTPHKPWKI